MYENERNLESMEDVGLTVRDVIEACATITCEAFGEGIEYAGLFLQVVAATIAAIILVIAFYLFQRHRYNKRELTRQKRRED